jgi:hypothetical protein
MHEAYRYFRGAILEWAAEGADSESSAGASSRSRTVTLPARITGQMVKGPQNYDLDQRRSASGPSAI